MITDYSLNLHEQLIPYPNVDFYTLLIPFLESIMIKKRLWSTVATTLLVIPQLMMADPLTLQDAIDRAVSENRTLQASSLNLESARRTYESSWNVFLPTATVDLSLNHSKTLTDDLFATSQAAPSPYAGMGTGTGSSSSSKFFTFTPSASASLSVDATIPNTLKQNALQYDMQLLSFQKQVAQIKQQTAEKFYNLIASKENIAILENSLALSSAQLASTTASYRSGTASELEYLQAQYSVHAIIPQIAQAKNQYESDLNAFKIFLGYDVSEDIEPTGDITVTILNLPADAELTELVENRYSQRFDMMQGQQQVQQAELNLSSAKLRAYLPLTVSDSVSVRQTSSTDSSKGFTVTNSISAGIRLNLTGLIPGSSTQLNIKKAEDSVTSAQMNLENTAISAKQSMSSAVEKLRLLEQTLELNQESLEISSRQYVLSQDSYANGLISSSQLDDYRQRLQQSQQNVLKAQINYLNGVNALASELNMSVEDVYTQFGPKE